MTERQRGLAFLYNKWRLQSCGHANIKGSYWLTPINPVFPTSRLVGSRSSPPDKCPPPAAAGHHSAPRLSAAFPFINECFPCRWGAPQAVATGTTVQVIPRRQLAKHMHTCKTLV